MHLRRLPLTSAAFAAAVLVVPPGFAQVTGTSPNFTISGGATSQASNTLTGGETLTQSGGTLNYTAFTVGSAGTSIYRISNGTATFGNLYLGTTTNINYGTGYVDHTGGTVSVADTLYVGRSNEGWGSYGISGGTVSARSVQIASATINGTSQFALAGTGILSTSNIGRGTARTNVYLTFNGGVLKAGDTDNSNWVDSGIQTFVQAGATFDTAGRNMGLHSTLQHDSGLQTDGGLTKKGAGTLTLYSTANTYNGATILQEGTLSVGSASSLGFATNAINFNGGTLRITGTSFQNFGSHSLNTSLFNGGLDIDDAANTFTLTQNLAGTGGLTKSGAGTLVLSGSSTRTGTTTLSGGILRLTDLNGLSSGAVVINDGTLQANSGTTIGSLSGTGGTISLLGFPGNLTINQTTNGTFAGTISDAFYLIKTGTGTLALTGNNTYTGETTLQGGTLSISSWANLSNPSSLRFEGGLLGIDGTAIANLNGVAVNASSFNGGFDIADANHIFTFDRSISGSGTLVKNGPGTLVLAANNFHSGGVLLQGGTLSVSAANQLGSASSPISFAGGVLRIVSTAIPDLGTHTLGANFNGGLDIAEAGHTFTLNKALTGSGSLTKLGAGTLALENSNTFTGGITVSAGLLQFSGTGAFGNASNKVTLNGGGLRWASGTTTDISSRLDPLGAYGGIFNTNGNNVTLATTLSGTGSFTKTGAGTLTLSALNTYTGGTIVNEGILYLGGSPINGVGVIRGALTINSGATLLSNASNAFGWQSGGVKVDSVTINGATLNNAYAGSLGWGIAYTLHNATLLSNGGVNSNSAASHFSFGGNAGSNTSVHAVSGTSTISGRVILRGDNGHTNVNLTVDNSATLAIPAGISSAGTLGLTKLGPGTLILSGTNDYTGNTYVNAGLVEFNSSASFGVAPAKVVLNGGGLRWASGTTTDISSRIDPLGASGGTFDTNGNNVTLATTISGTGSFTKAGGGTLTLSSIHTYSGGTIVDGGTLQLAGPEGTGVGVIRGNLTINSGATVRTSASNAFGYATRSKIDAVTINGGTLDHTGANDQGWGVAYTLNGGTMQTNGGISSSTTNSKFAFGNSTSLAVGAGTTATVAGRVDLRGDAGPTNTNFTVGSGGTLNVSAAITSSNGTTGFTKLGAGTMVLSGANTYTGGTTISAGTLVSANASAFGTGGVTLAAGADVGLLFDRDVFSGQTLSPTFTISSGTGSVTLGTTARPFDGSFVDISTALTLNRPTTLVDGGVGTGGRTSFNGIISGNVGTLSIAGGRVTLSAANVFTGDVVVKADTMLQLTGNGSIQVLPIASAVSLEAGGGLFLVGSHAIGSLAGAANSYVQAPVSQNSVLTVGANNADSTFAGTLRSSGPSAGYLSLVKTGSGTLTLSGNNRHTDGNTVSSGTLVVGHASALGAGLTTVASGATLDFASYTGLLHALLGSGTLKGTGTYSSVNNWSQTLDLVLTGSASLAKTGTGTLTLARTNTYSGGTAINAGLIQFGSIDNFGSGNITLNGGGLRWASGNTFDITSSSQFNREFGASGATFDTNGNNVTFAGDISGASSSSSLTKIGAGTLILSGTNTYAGGTRINEGTLQFAQANNLGSGSITVDGGTLRWASGNSADVSALFAAVGANGATLDIGSNDVTLATGLTGASAASSLTKAGSGILTLTGANTYAGTTTISQGTLQVGAGAASGSLVGNVSLGNATHLIFNRANDLTYAGVISGAGDVTKAGGGTLVLSGANSYTGGTTVSAGNLVAAHASSFGTGSITLAGGADNGVLFDRDVFAGQTINPSLSVGSGSGAATIGTVAQPAGGTFVNIGSALALNRPTTLVDGGADASGRTSFTGVISGNVGTLSIAGGRVELSAANVFTGDVVVKANSMLQLTSSGSTQVLPSAAAVSLESGGGLFLVGNHAIASLSGVAGSYVQAPMSLNSVLTVGANNADSTFAGSLRSSGPTAGYLSLVKVGSGTLTLSGNNRHTDGNTVSSGTLVVGHASALGVGLTTVASGATLDFGNYTGQLHALLGSGTLKSTGTYSSTTNGAQTLNLVLTGSASLAKTGTGILTLSAANTYTGATAVNAGTLVVNGSLGNTAVTVSSGATLSGSGTIAGATTLQAGSILAPGNSPGILTFSNNLTLLGTTLMELAAAGARGTAYDGIDVTSGTLSFGGTLTVSLINGFTPIDGSSFDLFNFTTGTGNFTTINLPTLTSGLTWNTSALYTTGILSVSASAIPEPSTYAALFGAGALGLALWRRRRANARASDAAPFA